MIAQIAVVILFVLVVVQNARFIRLQREHDRLLERIETHAALEAPEGPHEVRLSPGATL